MNILNALRLGASFKSLRVTGSLGVCAAALLAANPAAAANDGFETGDLTGWTLSGFGGADTSYGAFLPTQGTYLGYVQAGGGTKVYSTLSQTFFLSAGQGKTFNIGFQANDYMPFNDNAYFTVNGKPLFSSSVMKVGDFGNSGWQRVRFVAKTSGAYEFKLGVRNIEDNLRSSGAVIDLAVPEPATWAMMVMGFGLIGAGMRRRTATARFARA